MKKFLNGVCMALAMCACVAARADVVRHAGIVFTNNPAQSNAVVVDGVSRLFLTNVTNSASWTLLTNSVGGTATNFFLGASYYPFTNLTVLDMTNGTTVWLRAPVNSNLVVTFSTNNFAYVIYKTNTVLPAVTVAVPFTRETTAQRQVYVNQQVTNLAGYATNVIPGTNPIFGQLVNQTTNSQAMTNKEGYEFTLRSGRIVGGTNVGDFLVATGGVIRLEGAEEASGDRGVVGSGGIWFEAQGFKVAKLAPRNSFDALPSLFDSTGTNVFDLLAWLNGQPMGYYIPVTLSNGFYASLSTVLNLGTAFSMFPVIGDLGLGASNFWASSQRFAGPYYRVDATASFGTNVTVEKTNFVGRLVGTNIDNLGTLQGGMVSNVVMVNSSSTNLTNVASVMRNSRTVGSLDLQSDLAYGSTNFTSLANGNNIAVDFGSNVLVNITGTLTANGSICGVVNGRSGKFYLLHNDTAYDISLTQDTADPVEANRFANFSGGNLTVSSKGWAGIAYDASVSRWKTQWIYPTMTQATNAVALVNGVATNLSVFGAFAWTNGSGAVKMILVDTNGGFYLGDAPGGNSVAMTNGYGKDWTNFGALTMGTNGETVVRQGASNSLTATVGSSIFSWLTNGIFSVPTAGWVAANSVRSSSGLSLYVNNSTVAWQASSSGHFIAGTDASFDIGQPGATRPRRLYVSDGITNGGNLSVGGTITGNGSGLTNVPPQTIYQIQISSGSYADSTTYFPMDPIAANNVDYTNAFFRVLRACKLKSWQIRVRNTGVASSETVSHYIRVNDTTDVGQIDMTYATTNNFGYATNLSVTLSPGDTFAVKVAAPAWVTNPTAIRSQAWIDLE